MRIIIRTFFRGVRLILAPIVLIAETLTTPRAVVRTPDEQADVDRACERLALYHFRTCPFCIKVRRQIARLGLQKIALRDAQHDGMHRQALANGGGLVKVPCLRITHDDGHEEWLYESDAINAWLLTRFDKTA